MKASVWAIFVATAAGLLAGCKSRTQPEKKEDPAPVVAPDPAKQDPSKIPFK